MGKENIRLGSQIIGSCLIVGVFVGMPFLSHFVHAQDADFETQRRKVIPSVFYATLEGLISYRKKPASQEQVASYANTILAQKGFDFIFFVFPTPVAQPTEQVVIPCYRVTSKSIETTDLGGQPLTLKRPPSYRLFEIQMVDESLKKTIRRWELPDETLPFGLSSDGKKLYRKTRREGLVLEVSENRIGFVAAEKLKAMPLHHFIPVEGQPAGMQYFECRSEKTRFVLRYSPITKRSE
ncbi:MAG: hypothetical protein K1Y36_14865 [Blastocatellia bacterium]|nr:hypothetical protein [Blastocatellia bacterium]